MNLQNFEPNFDEIVEMEHMEAIRIKEEEDRHFVKSISKDHLIEFNVGTQHLKAPRQAVYITVCFFKSEKMVVPFEYRVMPHIARLINWTEELEKQILAACEDYLR